MESKKVLIVDDDEDILASTEMLLKSEGHEAILLRDWHNVVDVAAREHPDLILQDLRMPGFDLDAQVKALRENEKTAEVPVVLFSALNDIERTAREQGVGFLAKPFDYAELLAMLQEAAPVRFVARGRGR